MEVTKSECCEHDILFNIYQYWLRFFDKKKIGYNKCNDEALKNNQIAFQNTFFIKKY